MGSEERSRRYVSKQDLKEERDEIFNELSESLSKSLSVALSTSLTKVLTVELTNSLLPKISEAISEKLCELTSKVADIENISDKNSKDIFIIQSEISMLKQESSEQKDIINSLLITNAELEQKVLEIDSKKTQKKIDDLSELIEERTNRQLRQTLVFKGRREVKYENWDKTTSLLAKTFSSILENCNYDQAYDMINRAHRSPMNEDKKNMRDIYVNINYWSDCEEIVDAFRKKNINDNNFGIHVSYKYGPLTTARRSEALKMRKELKSEGVIKSGYVKYPAKLMVRYETDGPYVQLEDFSKMKVTLRKREK